MTKVLGYDYKIKYKPERENNVADALSWITSSPSLNHLFVSQNPLWDTIKNEAIDNLYIQRIKNLATDNPRNPDKWHNGLVCFKNWVVVPPQSYVLPQIYKNSMILQLVDIQAYSGHTRESHNNFIDHPCTKQCRIMLLLAMCVNEPSIKFYH